RVPGVWVEPSAVLAFGRAANAVTEYALAHRYTDVVVADRGPAGRALARALEDRLRDRAVVSVGTPAIDTPLVPA
ncbi:MAG: hypothetical protein KDB21_03030, partial [Acidimicrobiales bacterium]|nr:hypothetical protein [Acidimicrobiales bacterium]